MKTLISAENPFGQTRRLEHAYCWERIHKYAQENGLPRILDFGTYDGSMLYGLSRTGVVRDAIGVDVNGSAVLSLNNPNPEVSLITIGKGQQLPFAAASFDVVTLIGVLEHVYRQDQLLQDLGRVLVNDGRLFVSVPGQHAFSFMDLGNLKFRFPRLHRWYYSRKHSQEDYRKRYVEGENGLIGDIEVEKRWHEHFTFRNLDRLLSECGFEILDKDGFGYFMRPIHNAWLLSPILKNQLYRLMLSDMRLFSRAEIFVECRKTQAVTPN